jgi:hypothetical protein
VGAALLDLVAYLRNNPLPPGLAEAVLGPDKVRELREGVGRLSDGSPLPRDMTVGTWCQRWLATKEAEAAAEVREPSRLKLPRYGLGHFRDYLSSGSVKPTR